MDPSSRSPLLVHKLFHSLLSNSNATTSSAAQQASNTPRPTSPRLTSPPAKNSIRYIENDQNGRREKYDGRRWRYVCTWNAYECTNIAYSHQLCPKHNTIRRHKELPKLKKKILSTTTSLPNLNGHDRNKKFNYDFEDDDDDIQILEEHCKGPIPRHSMNSTVKAEATDFNIFSVEPFNDHAALGSIKSEPKVSSSCSYTTSDDVEYVASKIRSNGLNITELLAKNIPPLTDFEEEYLATRLIEKLPMNCLMIDAQLHLHNEAITVVKRNYRHKMDTIAPEYFYDFLLRHPRVAIHFRHWFIRFKPIPPDTGCAIDTKVWTLGMIVRGATSYNDMIDECTD